MTPVRLLTVAVLICTASAFAQEQVSSTIRSDRSAESERSTRVPTSDPGKIVLNESTDSRGSSLQWRQLDPIAVQEDARPGDDTLCYKIRSYVVARDSKDSDSVHPVGYSTCQPASRYRLRKTQIQTGSSEK